VAINSNRDSSARSLATIARDFRQALGSSGTAKWSGSTSSQAQAPHAPFSSNPMRKSNVRLTPR
jgi:hypothetical protein